jgi:hypothetical protein
LFPVPCRNGTIEALGKRKRHQRPPVTPMKIIRQLGQAFEPGFLVQFQSVVV